MLKNTESNSTRKLRKIDSFSHACEVLGISSHRDAILTSNSRGELFHLQDYYLLAQGLDDEALDKFPRIFEDIVQYAQKEWNRPQSVYQHIITLLTQQEESLCPQTDDPN